MRKLHLVGCLAGLLLAAAPAPATFYRPRPPVPEMVAGADTIVVGKVTSVRKDFITALPSRHAAKKVPYQIVEVQVEEALHGAKKSDNIKVGVRCYEGALPGAGVKDVPVAQLLAGQEYCLFLHRHHGGDFLELRQDSSFAKELNPHFKKDLALARRCLKLLGDTDKALKSRNVEERFLTAAMLIRKYRGPDPGPFATPAKDTRKQEPISAAESRLILNALASADWKKAQERTLLDPRSLFLRLGLTPRDGWTLKTKPAVSLDPRAVARSQAEFTRAAKRWLMANAGRYRIKPIVDDSEASRDDRKGTKKPAR
jgi:hypothetical protein